MIEITESFRKKYSKASVGFLLINNVKNQQQNDKLTLKKKELEAETRKMFKSFTRQDLNCLENNKSYNEYYKKFKKTYHVLMELESIAHKDKNIPEVDCLVECMFMAEIKNQILTAGHDVSKIEFPIKVDVATGDEKYIGMNGKEVTCKKDDMIMYDNKGVISSVICGPDSRTKITMDTTHVLYMIYAPEGIIKEEIRKHLEDIKDNISIISSDFLVEELQVI